MWGYLHWTGRCQVCSLTSVRPGVLTRHSSSAPASPRSGVIRVEVTRRLPSTELCKQRPEVTHYTLHSDAWLTWVWVWVSCWPFFHHDTLWLGLAPRTCYLLLSVTIDIYDCLLLPDLALQPPGHAHHQGNIRAENLDWDRRHWNKRTPTHYANAEKTLLNWVKYQIHFITIKVCAFISGSLIRQIIRENIYEGEITRAKICSIDHKEPFLQSMYFSMIGVGWPRSSDTSNNVSILYQ